MTLLDRVNAWLAQPMEKKEAYLIELGDIYFEITGQRVACKGCNYSDMRRVLKAYSNKPSPLNLNPMATTKYEFVPAAVKDNVSIVLHYPNSTKLVTPDNITDRDAEHILNDPGLKDAYGHNIRVKKSADVDGDGDADNDDVEALAAARIEYETVTGNKPGNRTLATLRAAIDEAKSSGTDTAE